MRHCPSCPPAHRALGPGRPSKLISLPSAPHPARQSRDDKGGAHVAAVQHGSHGPGLYDLPAGPKTWAVGRNGQEARRRTFC